MFGLAESSYQIFPYSNVIHKHQGMSVKADIFPHSSSKNCIKHFRLGQTLLSLVLSPNSCSCLRNVAAKSHKHTAVIIEDDTPAVAKSKLLGSHSHAPSTTISTGGRLSGNRKSLKQLALLGARFHSLVCWCTVQPAQLFTCQCYQP